MRSIGHGEKPAGAAPGTVIYIGEERKGPVQVDLIRYGNSGIEEQTDIPVEQCSPPELPGEVSWFNVDGIHNTDLLQHIGERFGLHPLVVEDIANTNQRPKFEEYDTYLFMTLKMIAYNGEAGEIEAEHVSIVLGKGYVISFLEDRGDVFEPVRSRLRGGRGKIRATGADYLLYALLDAIVDRYFEALGELGDDIENVEQEVLDKPSPEIMRSIHLLKRELIFLRRSVWPLREAVSILMRDDSSLISDDTKVFLRDLYDHTIHTIDTVEALRDIVSGMLDVYLSSISNRMNEIMKVLTVMSSIFIPLTFIVGVYGMNFKYMPELESPYGYPAVLALMAFIAGVLLVFFRRRGWL